MVDVVRDIRVRGLDRSSKPRVYLPAAQTPDTSGDLDVPKDLVVRATTGACGLVAPALRAIRVSPLEAMRAE